MNKTIRIAIGAMAICGSVLMGGGFVSASDHASSVDGQDSSIKVLIPDTITLPVNESAYIETDSTYQYVAGKVNALLQESVEQTLKSKGADFESVSADCGFLYYGEDFYACDLFVQTGANSTAKVVTLKYANTSDANATNKAAVQSKLNAVMVDMQADKNLMIPAGKYVVSYHMYTPGTTAEVIAADNEKAADETKQFVEKILGDSSYEIYAQDTTAYGNSLGYLPSKPTSVLVFKNGEFYGALRAMDIYAFYDNEGGTTTKTEIAKDDKVYTELAAKLEDKGYKTILGAYELKNSSNTSRFFLSFDVDSKYNGKTVVVLHKLANGTYEEFESKVEDGVVEIETSSLSPFMIALKETTGTSAGSNTGDNSNTSNNATTNTTTTATAAKPNSPSTPDTGAAVESDGSRAVSVVFGTVILGVAACLVAVAYTTKKVIARKKEQQA